MNVKRICRKYRDIFLYGIFGVLTTSVNIFAYWFMAHPVGTGTIVSTIIAWIVAVSFAYITNRKWVFHGTTDLNSKMTKELAVFFLCRLITGVIDWSLMFICVDLLLWNDMVVKIVVSVIIIVLNYIFSKIIVFREIKD